MTYTDGDGYGNPQIYRKVDHLQISRDLRFNLFGDVYIYVYIYIYTHNIQYVYIYIYIFIYLREYMVSPPPTSVFK